MSRDEIKKVLDLEFEKYIDTTNIEQKVGEIARQIDQTYQDKKPICLIILKGAFMFGSDLIKAMSIDCEVYFAQLSSYDGMSTTGQVKNQLPLDIDIAGRDIILIEDIIDTGTTMYYYTLELQKQKPSSIAIASFLVKPDAIIHPVDIAFKGFEIPNDFVIGYGLDYNQAGRQLTDIYKLKP